MVVPPCGSEVTRSVPPISRARSSMPWRPRPRSLAVAGSKPRPLSEMATVMSRPCDVGADPGHGRVGVLADVGERLLDDAQQLDLLARRQRRGQPGRGRERDPQPRALPEVVHGARQHLRQRQVGIQAGAHRDQRLARLHDRRVERLADLARERPRPRPAPTTPAARTSAWRTRDAGPARRGSRGRAVDRSSSAARSASVTRSRSSAVYACRRARRSARCSAPMPSSSTPYASSRIRSDVVTRPV